jgi:hypothetical protein
MRLRLGLSRIVGSSLVLTFLVLCLVQCRRATDTTIVLPQKRISVSDKAANDIVDQLSEIMKTDQAFNILLTDEGLTSYMQVYIVDDNLHEPTAWVTGQGIYAGARLGRRGEHEVRALVAIQVDRGTLYATISRATFDGLALPRFLLYCMEEIANTILADMPWPVQIEQIVLEEGALTIQGRPRTSPAK